MKFISRLLIAVALLTTGSLALAQSQRDHDHDGRQDDRHQHGDRHDDRRHYDNRHYGYHNAPRYDRHPRWERGHRYNGPVYVVRDYGHYRLRPPPRGYHWVRSNNDYLLIGIATGVILDMALH